MFLNNHNFTLKYAIRITLHYSNGTVNILYKNILHTTLQKCLKVTMNYLLPYVSKHITLYVLLNKSICSNQNILTVSRVLAFKKPNEHYHCTSISTAYGAFLNQKRFISFCG